MENPERIKRFLQRVDDSLSTINESININPVPRPVESFLSQEQLDAHYNDHYLGYLKGLRKAEKQLINCSDPRKAMLDISFNYNGVLLHEIYFECLGSQKMSKDLRSTLNKSFGSKAKLMKQLKDALMASKSGWAYLGFDKRFTNFRIGIIDLHETHVALWQPVLALDVWEHAFYIDFKTDKKQYINGILDDINWEVVERRIDEILRNDANNTKKIKF